MPELYNRVGALNAHRRNTRSLPSPLRSTVSAEATRVQKAWDHFTGAVSYPTVNSTQTGDEPDVVLNAQEEGPSEVEALMATAWDQDFPYNTMTPEISGCPNKPDPINALTNCVATVWAQVMYYHRWPDEATGSHRYSWNGTPVEAVFEGVSYDWGAMPRMTADVEGTTYTPDAVSLLMFHAGVAAEMNYGCDDSGSGQYANDVLDTYFNYKAMERHDRLAETDAVEWFELLKSEMDAERIVIFSIFGVNGGGHEVVVDGYRVTTTPEDPSVVLSRKVHINLGWGGNHDAYYDISNDFATPEEGEYVWTASFQVAVTGIEPNEAPRPVVIAGTDKQQVLAGDTVALIGGALVQGQPVQRYQWLQVGIGTDAPAVVVLSDHDTLNAAFRAPEVEAPTDLVFMLKVTDTNRSVGFDKVTVTVHPEPSPSNRGSSSSGPCFISTLQSP